MSRSWSGRIGVVLFLLLGAIAIVGPYIAPYSPTRIATGPLLAGISTAHWLGTDALGRDVLSRLLNGGRSLLILPGLSVLVAFVWAGPLGVWSAYRGGATDIAVTRVVDLAMSLPPLLVVMVVVGILGASNLVLIVSVAFFLWPRIVRIIRGASQTICAQDYVTAARARGEPTWSIILYEVAPNITGPMVAELSIRFSYAVIIISTLNFLGLGVQPPSSDWGLMASEGRVVIPIAPLVSIAPAVAIALLSISANLIGDVIAAHLSRVQNGGSRP